MAQYRSYHYLRRSKAALFKTKLKRSGLTQGEAMIKKIFALLFLLSASPALAQSLPPAPQPYATNAGAGLDNINALTGFTNSLWYYLNNGGGASVTPSSIAAAIQTQTGCTTAGYVWVPASNTCVTQGAATVAIGGAVTSGTANSILFVGAGPVLSQDNAAFSWVDSTKVLTIGTAGAGGVTIPFFGTAGIIVNNASGVLSTTTTLPSSVTSSSLTSAGGGAFGTNAYNSTAFAPAASPTFTGTVTTPLTTAGLVTTTSGGVIGSTATVPVANGGTGLSTVGTNGQVLQSNGSAIVWGSGSGSGTVTSVTFTGDGTVLSSTPSSAVTTSGTLTASLAAQTQNTVLGAATSTTLAGLAMPSCSATGSALEWTTNTGFGCHTITGGVSSFSGDGALLSNSSSTGAVTDTLANAAANTVWGNNTSSSAAPGYQTSISITGNITSATTTASTSGTQQQISPILALNGTWWNGSTGTNVGYTQVTYTPDGNASGLLNFKMDGDNTGLHEARFIGTNSYGDFVNKNDSEGAFEGETFNSAQFGVYNTSGSAKNKVSANSGLSMLGLTDNGVVETLQSAFGNPSVRNILDDGTSSAHMAYKVLAPTVSSCGTSPSIDAYASDSAGKVTIGSGTVTSCTVTFATAYGTKNHCRVTPETASLLAFGYSYSLSAITVTATSLTSAVFDYNCDGS